ncbi:MAG: RDD family protein [Vicinamibacterales bacterium]
MRCSKCQYISFDNSDRCRNCGYEFSLSADVDAFDLPIRTGDEPSGPLADFSLADLDALEPLQPPVSAPPPARVEAPPRASSAPARRSPSSGELPLFRDRGRDDDAPLVSLPAAPRAPVAVRKSAVAARPEPRAATQAPGLDLGFGGDEERDHRQEAAARERPASKARRDGAAGVAGIIPRLFAAVIDLVLLAGIDAVVLYFTLRLCGLEFGDVLRLPLMPFAAFIAFLNGGYVVAFTTAGGQTIGKMLTGIRVVTSDEDAWTDRVPVGGAALRAVGYVMSALPAGLGFLPVLFGAERRGLHDRLAHTRVVKA